MSRIDAQLERASATGNTTAPILSRPTITGTVRRTDPDGGHANPYFPSLASTSLTIEIGTTLAGITHTYTINFTTAAYADAVAAVNAVSPSNIQWVESGGYAGIANINSGGKNYLKITGGTAAPLLGFAVYPAPGSYSQAGDIAAAPVDKVQANPQTTELLAHDENLSSSSINRAILGALLGLDKRLNDLDREISTYIYLSATQFSESGSSPSDTLCLTNNGDGINRFASVAFAGLGSLLAVLDPSTLAPLYDSGNNLINVTQVTYGPSDSGVPSGTSITWGTPPTGGVGVSIIQNGVYGSLKTALTAISSIVGSTIYAPGSAFVTNGVVENDVITIRSAANTIPFDHSGQFVITQVIDNDRIAVRPMGPNETLVPGGVTEDKPRALNTNTSGIFGNVAVYVGFNIPMVGPSGASKDKLFFRCAGGVSTPFTNGQVVTLRIPVAATLRQALTYAFLSQTEFGQDAQIAYLNKANIFALLNTFNKGISVTGDTSGPNVHGVIAVGGSGGGDGVKGTGTTSNIGVHGIGGPGAGSYGVYGAGVGGYGVGGIGQGTFAGIIGGGGSANAPGIVGTGGATGGRGGEFSGTAASADGVRGIGASTNGRGVYGVGTGNGAGVRGEGDTGGAGVQGFGGASDADGVFGQGGGTNGNGVHGVGYGTGAGVLGGGDTTNPGVRGNSGSSDGANGVEGISIATNGTGIQGTGTGTGAGVKGIGGATGPAFLASGFYETTEQTSPASPAATKFRFFARSNGLSTPNHRTQAIIKGPNGTETVIWESDPS